MTEIEGKLPLTGGCLCGAVRYEVRAQPLTLAICHCSQCQTRTGSAFAMSLAVPREGLVVCQGQGSTLARDLPGASGKLIRQHFCEHCLVRLYSEPSAFPNVSYVRPGTLDDRSWLRPAAQIWTQEAMPWARVDGVPEFASNAPDVMELLRLYRSQARGSES